MGSLKTIKPKMAVKKRDEIAITSNESIGSREGRPG
jgi:hypothetical protein